MPSAQIKSFEDLEIYQLALELTEFIYKITQKFPEAEKFVIIAQIRRAVISIGANIAEGFGRYHFRERIRFLHFSRGSLAEVKHFMMTSQKLRYINNNIYAEYIEKHNKLSIKLNNYIRAMSGK